MDPFQHALTQLASSQIQARNAAITTLHRLGDPRAIAPLIHVLLHDPSQYPRARAAKALNDLGDERVVPPLLAALQDAGQFVRIAAARALATHGTHAVVPDLLRALHDRKPLVQAAAAQALAQRQAIEELITALFEAPEAEETHWWQMRVSILYQLRVQEDPRVLPALIQALGDPRLRVASEAALCLGEPGNSQAVDPLLARLSDTSAPVRWCVAQALGQIGDRKAIPALISCLTDENGTVRASATFALGKLDASEALEALRAVAEADPHEFTRRGAKGVVRELEARHPAR